MFDDAIDPVDATHDGGEVAAPDDPHDIAPPMRNIAPRSLWRAGAVVLALVVYALSAQLAANDVVVQPGDTLSKIAGDYHISVRQLASYNGVDDPNVIRAGQILVIPPPAGEIAHEVRIADTVNSIAATYGVTPDAIVARNKLTNPNLIRIGQVLLVPRPAPLTTTTRAPAPTTPIGATPPTIPPTPTATRPGPTTTTVAAPTSTAAALATPVPSTTMPFTTIPKVSVPSGGLVSTMWVVQPEDTLASIAARFGIAVRRLAAVNALLETDQLIPGQRIFVPQS